MAATKLPHLRSSAPILFHVEKAGSIAGIPARDLTGADLEYIARTRALRESGGQPVAPRTAEHLDAVADELVATGVYAKPQPKAKSTPKTKPQPPAAPAEEN